MKRLIIWSITLFITCSLFVMPFGCAGSQKVKEDFFQNWQRKAEESKGHSPRASTDKDRTMEKFEEEKPEREKQKPTKKLPQKNVTLQIKDANIQTIIRALARAADQDILMTDNIKGQTSINIVKQPWNEAFKAILSTHGYDYIWKGDILKVISPQDLQRTAEMEKIQQQRQEQKLQKKQVEGLVTRMVNIHYADASEVKKSLQKVLIKDKEGKTRGNIIVDEHNNALILKAIPDDMDKMLKLIKSIDKPTNQINIKAHIVETTRDTGRYLGMQWGGAWQSGVFDSGRQDNRVYITPGGSGGSTSSNPLQGNYDPSTGDAGLSGQGFNINFPVSSVGQGMGAAGASLGMLVGEVGGNILEMQLSALEESNKLQILSSPSLTTMDNQKAFTESGSEIPYETTSEQGTNIQMEEATLRLEITPHIIDKQYLKMNILIKNDEPDFANQVEGRPLIKKQQTKTTCIVRNGETVVISGLTKERVTKTDKGVPLFKDIPGLGWLFKGDSRGTSMQEILVFITPEILKKPGKNT